MSMGPACKCSESKKPIEGRNWRIVAYKCNRSAFNGYHYTHSDYSAIQCRSCLAYWRTKAAFVEKLQTGEIK